MDWSTPKIIADVRSFMCLGGYYRRFIEGLPKVLHLITSFQRKNVKFVWSEKYEVRFQQLKKLLANAPFLKIANPKKDFVVCIDACIEVLGGVLMQKDFVNCYE